MVPTPRAAAESGQRAGVIVAAPLGATMRSTFDTRDCAIRLSTGRLEAILPLCQLSCSNRRLEANKRTRPIPTSFPARTCDTLIRWRSASPCSRSSMSPGATQDQVACRTWGGRLSPARHSRQVGRTTRDKLSGASIIGGRLSRSKAPCRERFKGSPSKPGFAPFLEGGPATSPPSDEPFARFWTLTLSGSCYWVAGC